MTVLLAVETTSRQLRSYGEHPGWTWRGAIFALFQDGGPDHCTFVGRLAAHLHASLDGGELTSSVTV